jgi:hypothetical protein
LSLGGKTQGVVRGVKQGSLTFWTHKIGVSIIQKIKKNGFEGKFKYNYITSWNMRFCTIRPNIRVLCKKLV